MSKKVDFRNIVIRDVNGQEQKADVAKQFGNLLYMQGQNIEECELGQVIYHTADEGPGELELSDSQCEVVARFAAMLPFVVRTGILAAIAK